MSTEVVLATDDNDRVLTLCRDCGKVVVVLTHAQHKRPKLVLCRLCNDCMDNVTVSFPDDSERSES